MASMQDVLTGLATRLATISGLKTYDYLADSIVAPAAVISPEQISYDSSQGGATADPLISIKLAVARSNDRLGQKNLYAYTDTTGASSVAAAVAGGPTLGGAAHYAVVSEARNFGLYTFGDVTYYGCEFVVQVGVA